MTRMEGKYKMKKNKWGWVGWVSLTTAYTHSSSVVEDAVAVSFHRKEEQWKCIQQYKTHSDHFQTLWRSFNNSRGEDAAYFMCLVKRKLLQRSFELWQWIFFQIASIGSDQHMFFTGKDQRTGKRRNNNYLLPSSMNKIVINPHSYKGRAWLSNVCFPYSCLWYRGAFWKIYHKSGIFRNSNFEFYITDGNLLAANVGSK